MKAAAVPVGMSWMWTLAFGHHEDRTPTHGYADDARGRDGGVRQELAAGVVLRSGGRSAFGGKAEKHTLVLSLTGSYPSAHLEAFARLAYRP